MANQKSMLQRVTLTGNEAVALAMKQINPDVVAAYPITPQTDIVQYFSSFVANGDVDTNFVTVESEHSAMSATIGASAAGSRAMTATSSQGLALMWEELYIAAGMRLPIVMPVVNRALSGPINIHCDHSDAMGARDSGWIQLFCENAQEAYDNVIQALKIAEHPEVLLPVMVCQDGFVISHSLETLEVLDDESVKQFIGEYNPRYKLLDADNPITMGPFDLHDFYFEHKRQQAEAMANATRVILEVASEYAKLSGRNYQLFEEYMTSDAEIIVMAMGSTAGTVKAVVDKLRSEGQKVGLLKLRVFRPFPHKELRSALEHARVIAVMDRAEGFCNFGGPLLSQVMAALYESANRPIIVNYIYGLGGRDTTVHDIQRVFHDASQIAKIGKYENLVTYLGVRE